MFGSRLELRVWNSPLISQGVGFAMYVKLAVQVRAVATDLQLPTDTCGEQSNRNRCMASFWGP
jgi:hypothetical protein